MNWLAWVAATALAAGLDGGFTEALAIGPVRPLFLPAVATFTALHAPRRVALWAALLAGFLADLLAPSHGATGASFHVLGAHTLGYTAGASLVLLLRAMVFRSNPLTLGFMTAVFCLTVTLVVTAILSLRRWYPDETVPWGAAPAFAHLGTLALGDLWSGAWAIALAWPLNATMARWNFGGTGPRWGGRAIEG